MATRSPWPAQEPCTCPAVFSNPSFDPVSTPSAPHPAPHSPAAASPAATAASGRANPQARNFAGLDADANARQQTKHCAGTAFKSTAEEPRFHPNKAEAAMPVPTEPAASAADAASPAARQEMLGFWSRVAALLAGAAQLLAGYSLLRLAAAQVGTFLSCADVHIMPTAHAL